MIHHLIKTVTVVLSFTLTTLNAQTPFTNYFCELDTQFNGKEIYTKQSLTKNSIWSSNHVSLPGNKSNGIISGATLNRNGNFKYFPGSSNIKTFSNANVYTTHNFDSSNIKISKFGKSELVFNVGESATLSSFNYIPFANDLNPKPIQFGNIELGTSNYQTTNNRGNLFAIESFYANNTQVYAAIKDSFSAQNAPAITTSNFPNDNTNFTNILGKLNSAEYTGWIIEMDRLTNSFQKRRFDLGRSPRKAIIINSNRTSASASLANISRTFQILGDNEFNILIKTELNNNVQEFYVYSEEDNTLGTKWSLVNEISGGSVQPLSRNALTNLFQYIITKTELEFTYFLNVTDIEHNPNTNSLLVITPGGTADINAFKSKYGINNDLVVSSYLIPLLSASNYTDKLGHIIEIDGEDNLTSLRLGITTTSGKFVSNIDKIGFTNLSYIDAQSDPQNTSFAIFSESVFDNSAGQNPSFKKNSSEFQNEVYLVNLKEVLPSASVVDFKNKNFELFQTLDNNTMAMPISYRETYLPYFYISKNQNNNVDSFCFMRGFAEFYVAPEVCSQSNSNDEILKSNVVYGVYPNPLNRNNGSYTLNLISADATAIYSLQGNLIAAFDKSTSIEVDSIKPGLYIIKGSQGWTEKIVIQ